jgi:hypothetical protein
LFVDANYGIDSQLEYVVDAGHFLAAAFDVGSSHALRNSLALLWRNWCQPLRFEKLDACALVAKVRLEAN